MRRTAISCVLICLTFALAENAAIYAQRTDGTSGQENSTEGAVGAVVGHPFSAIKYAKRVRVLPDGKLRFIRNERYPSRIARDAQGRVMMESISSDDLLPECDQLQLEKPPPCPAWGVFVLDPVARVISHWVAGDRAAHGVVDMPLTEADMDRIRSTSEIPDVSAQFDPAEGEPKTLDLGVKTLDGILAHGVRTSLESRDTHRAIRIHEVWTAPEMRLIVRVIDGDPGGIETMWGLEKVSLQPGPDLFRPPNEYRMLHQTSDVWAAHDFEYLETWFEK